MNSQARFMNLSNAVLCMLCLSSICLTTCSKKLLVTEIRSVDQISSTKAAQHLDYRCNQNLAYAPLPEEEYSFLNQQLRVNFHFLTTKEGTHNFKEKEASTIVKQLIQNANLRLNSNHKMKLPVGNNTAVCSPMYQYVLAPQSDDTGIYFHADDELCFFANKGKHRNNYNTQVIKTYAIGLDSIINVFFMPHIPEKMRDKKYKVSQTGVALGNGLKIAGFYESRKKPWEIATLLNHEIGHILSLRHSWNSNDGCDDTPRHSNCWSSKPGGDCEVASNNAMDYNNSQMAWSPCQLGQVHRQFNKLNSSQRGLLIPNWCQLSSKQIVIDKSITWEGAKDLNKSIVISDNAELTIRCRLHLPKGAKITVEPGGSLVLDGCRIHNDCGEEWFGIDVLSKGKKTGIVTSIGDVSLENVLVD